MDKRSQHPQAPSIVALVSGIANDAKDLLLQEMAPAWFSFRNVVGIPNTVVQSMG